MKIDAKNYGLMSYCSIPYINYHIVSPRSAGEDTGV
jgi:hypothetical protein